ncbi:hypothetical protein [Yoonia litorea]|uniref:Uncharacterized protein n=1 Tax=Yoonia litorea TaxID=1123755 RepID=A0A1I6MEB8_9RHOB|nr:hypothetical protein [Yoonia litorea]SFS14001.1 hypothetical protein SAMN05444714_1635 [Yoonia litorea]
MTDDPIKLDVHRTTAARKESEMRRRTANNQQRLAHVQDSMAKSVESQILLEPARTWIDVAERCRFLLIRFAASPDAQDERVRKLIARALTDLRRLKKLEERKK